MPAAGHICSAVLGTPIEVNGENHACTASSLFPAAGADSGQPVRMPAGNTPITLLPASAFCGIQMFYLDKVDCHP